MLYSLGQTDRLNKRDTLYLVLYAIDNLKKKTMSREATPMHKSALPPRRLQRRQHSAKIDLNLSNVTEETDDISFQVISLTVITSHFTVSCFSTRVVVSDLSEVFRREPTDKPQIGQHGGVFDDYWHEET